MDIQVQKEIRVGEKGPMLDMQGVNVAELGIRELLEHLQTGRVTSVDLVCAYLNRIAYFDLTGACLNAVPILNPDALAEAVASDERRAQGVAIGPLEGIPFTVKDSFKVRGMTVASGSPAFQGLIADSDAASVELLRNAGAVLLGKTNMPPMTAGGVQPGVYGYAKNPYHPGYHRPRNAQLALRDSAAGHTFVGNYETCRSTGSSANLDSPHRNFPPVLIRPKKRAVPEGVGP